MSQSSYRTRLAAPSEHRPPPQGQAQVKSITIPPPFPWATNRLATVHSREYLLQNNIYSIAGTVRCMGCKKTFNMRFDLEEQLDQLRKFVQKESEKMRGMAPAAWVKPGLPKCQYCGRRAHTPSLSGRKEQLIGCSYC